jgi:hypothetical protein
VNHLVFADILFVENTVRVAAQLVHRQAAESNFAVQKAILLSIECMRNKNINYQIPLLRMASWEKRTHFHDLG